MVLELVLLLPLLLSVRTSQYDPVGASKLPKSLSTCMVPSDKEREGDGQRSESSEWAGAGPVGGGQDGAELAKRAAAAWISACERERPPAMSGGLSGKLKRAERPRRQKRAASKARAAFSAES